MKVCTKCGQEKLLNEYYKSESSKDGLRGQCKSCNSEYNKIRYSQNKDKIKKQSSVWQSENREKRSEARRLNYKKNLKKERLLGRIKQAKRKQLVKHNLDVTIQEINNLIQTSNNICFWCNQEIPEGQLQIDHVYPLSKRGRHSISNLVVSCAFCNKSKGNKDPEVFIDQIIEMYYKNQMA